MPRLLVIMAKGQWEKEEVGEEKERAGGKISTISASVFSKTKIKKLFVEKREMSLIQDKSLIWQFGAERSLG